MTKGLDKVFGLPSMEEILAETEEGTDTEENAENTNTTNAIVEAPQHSLMNTKAIEDHGNAMDVIHDEMLQHAKDITELAYDLDPARAPRLLEVGAMYYKGAMDAKNSKRDAELKMLTLLQNERKLKIEETKLGLSKVSDKADVVMVEDRNTLLKRLREEASKSDGSEPK